MLVFVCFVLFFFHEEKFSLNKRLRFFLALYVI